MAYGLSKINALFPIDASCLRTPLYWATHREVVKHGPKRRQYQESN